MEIIDKSTGTEVINLLMFSHLLVSLHLMYCTMLILAHLYTYTLDYVEPELEEPTEQAQAKDPANPNLTQGKP
jgi:hypothetical protein